MTSVAHPSNPADRLAGLIDGLCKAVAAHGPRGLLTVPLLLLLWSRLSRMARRARRLAERLAAEKPIVAPVRPRALPRAAPARPYLRLPRAICWLVRVVPGTASGAATLQFLLDDPEMAAVAHTPSMRRVLRPLCRMLGVTPPVQPPAPPPVAAEPPQPLGDEPPPCHPSAPPRAASPENAA